MYDANHLASVLRNGSDGRDGAVFATRTVGGDVTFGTLFANAEKVAAALVDGGLTPGGRVAAQIDKSVEAIELYLGTVLAGGVFLPLNTAYTATELAYFLGDAGPSVFVCDPAKYDALATVAEGAAVPLVLTLDRDGMGTLSETVAQHSPGFQAIARADEDLAAILYTSGTTGRSKGAMLTHGNLASNAETLAKAWRFTPQDVLIHALPIFHTHGLFVATNVVLVSGSSMIFMPGFDADAVMAAMPRATVMMGVPTFYVRLLAHPDLDPGAVAKMRLFTSGSAPLLAETHDLWRERTGHAILERYGMTETNMNTSNPYEGQRKAGTVGMPLEGVELRIVDPATRAELSQGEIGAIEVRGPNVFSGYWQMPEKTAEELREDGFFITGDIGVIDEQGYVSIVGRSKDLIISGGYNVYPKEIESLIDELDGVAESAVIGLPHADFGEGTVAVVVPRAGAELTEQEILTGIGGDLARYKQPKRVFFVDELPRNTMGKVQKNLLRDTYADTFTKA